MNIFVLDTDPVACAEMHADKHVVKMILETAQLLSAGINLRYGGQVDGLYKTTHQNHPCSIWARQTRSNFLWLADLGVALCDEYNFRYGKIHKSLSVIERAQKLSSLITLDYMTPFAQAMPELYKSEDAVKAYRNYYKIEKSSIAKWTKRSAPLWFNS